MSTEPTICLLLIASYPQALFDAGKESKAAYDEHIKAECGQTEDAEIPEHDQQPQPAGEGTSAAAAASGSAASDEKSDFSKPTVALGKEMLQDHAAYSERRLDPMLGKPLYRWCEDCCEYHEIRRVSAAAAAAAPAQARETVPKPSKWVH